jgi:hypothetical protein
MKLGMPILFISSSFLCACSSVSIKSNPIGFKAKFECKDTQMIHMFSTKVYGQATVAMIKVALHDGAKQKNTNWCNCYLISLEEF